MTLHALHDKRIPGPQSQVWIRVGALDWSAVRQAREVFSRPVVRTSPAVMVEFSHLDDHHELTILALLAELTRNLSHDDGVVTAVRPPTRLVSSLRACGVEVSHDVADTRDASVVIDLGTVPGVEGPPAARHRGAS